MKNNDVQIGDLRAKVGRDNFKRQTIQLNFGCNAPWDYTTFGATKRIAIKALLSGQRK